MPKPSASKFESATARLRLEVRRQPYSGPSLARGIKLLYRRCQGNGSWVVKAANGHGAYWTKAFAEADDFEKADGKKILSFYQAQDMAKAVARGNADEANPKKPATVADALAAYERSLRSRGKSTKNVSRVRGHMIGPLAGKPVALLTKADLLHWRDHLVSKGLEPSSVNRTMKGLRAALGLAALLDDRINSREVFREGLKALPNSNKARRMVLPDADVLRIVQAAYGIDRALGALVEVLAQTGARISQAMRLRCIDLRTDPHDPRLMMPTSYKGSGNKHRSHVPVSITTSLAALLTELKGDRPHEAPLLLRADGRSWQGFRHERLFRVVVERAGLDPNQITSYALRHSSICRQLLKNVPPSIVARTHDTSVIEIENHYGHYILDVSGQIIRRALLQPEPRAAANVVPIGGR